MAVRVGESRRARAAGIVAAVVSLAGAAAVPASADAPPTVVCTYTVTIWHGGFMANVAIANNGPAIDGWTVRWTFHDPTTIVGTWSSTISQNATGVVTATNMPYNAVIRTGQVTDFGWSANAVVTSVPTDITINGTPC